MAAEQNALLAAAKCFRCLSHARRLEIQTYLIAVLAGGSTDPNTLAAAARCWCLSDEALEAVLLYLLCVQSGATSCTADDIEAGAACYECISEEMLEAANTYSLAVAAGGSTDPGTLGGLATGFRGMSERTLVQIQVDSLQDLTGVFGTPAEVAALATDLRGISERRREGALANFFLSWSETPAGPSSEDLLTDSVENYLTDSDGNRFLVGV